MKLQSLPSVFFYLCEEITTGKNIYFNAYHENNSIREYNLIVFLYTTAVHTYTIVMHTYSYILYTELHTNTCETLQRWGYLHELMCRGVHYCYVHYTFHLYHVKN